MLAIITTFLSWLTHSSVPGSSMAFGPLLAAILPAIIGAAGSAGASAIGAAGAGGDRASQRAMLEKIMAEYGNIDVPTLERIMAEQLGPSAQEGVRGEMDPNLKADQLSTLSGLDQYSREGGNAETKAALSRVMGDLARQESAGRESIMQNMRARGISGSGAELAAQLQAQQGSADRAQTAGLDQAAQQQRRMYDAMVQKGRMAGDMRTQDYHELSDAARAKDMINQYNAQGREKANYYNAQLPAQQFQMKMAKTAGKANAMAGVASNYGTSADRSAATGAGVGNAIATGAGAAGDYFAKQDKEEKDRELYKSIYGGRGGGSI